MIRFRLAPLVLALLILPLAVAGQNIGAAVAGLALILTCLNPLDRSRAAALWQWGRAPLLASAAYLAALLAGTWLNPGNPASSVSGTVFGHLVWMLLPPVAALAAGPLSAGQWRLLSRVLAAVGLVMGVIAVTQAVWGWRVVGSAFVAGPTRSYGLYSHPLTFAYVGLVLFPLGVLNVLREPRRWASWGLFVGALAVIILTRSRTVQAVAVLCLAANCFRLLAPKWRWPALVALALGITGVMATDNPISAKFRATVGGGYDVRSGYADDRLAFWHAHTLMIQERPWFGHGDHLGVDYRRPYYERLGLAGFERQYEAHNAYLQALADAGVVGLAGLLLWFGWHGRLSWRHRGTLAGDVGWQTLLCLAVAALTQNAFQDAEVRFALALWATALWLRFGAAPISVTAGGSATRAASRPK